MRSPGIEARAASLRRRRPPLVGALAYLGAAPVEMFLFGRPGAMRFLHVEAENVEDVRMWAFVVGCRNLLVGVGTLVGLTIYRAGDEVVGEAVVLTACVYMLLASLAMGVGSLAGWCLMIALSAALARGGR